MPVFITRQVILKSAPLVMPVLSVGLCDSTLQAYFAPEVSSVGVADGTVGVARMKINVGVGVVPIDQHCRGARR